MGVWKLITGIATAKQRLGNDQTEYFMNILMHDGKEKIESRGTEKIRGCKENKTAKKKWR